MKRNLQKELNLLWLFVLVILCSCHYVEEWLEEPHGMEIYNATNDTICIYVATGYYGESPTAYPDTILPVDRVYWNEETISNKIRLNAIPPHSTLFTLPILDKKMKPIFSLPKDTLSIFFISKDTLNQFGYDLVRRHNIILERYDLSVQEIIEIYKGNKIITFPHW